MGGPLKQWNRDISTGCSKSQFSATFKYIWEKPFKKYISFAVFRKLRLNGEHADEDE
jgi:hypothetical protein